MWSCVNSVIGRFKAHKLISEISLDSVNSLNCYFNSAGLTPYHQSAKSFELSPSEQFDDVFLFSGVTTSTVLSHLKSLDTRKFAGPDNLIC